MTRKAYFASAAVAGAVLIAGASGYLARASVAPGPVNGSAATAPTAGAYPSFADIVQRVAPAVVSIDVEGKAQPAPAIFGIPGGQDQGDGDGDSQGQGQGQGAPFGFDFRQLVPQGPGQGGALPKMQASGSGFFISADGYIVTNNHVVEGADKITVHTADDRTLPARLIGRDPATDLAVVKVDGGGFAYVSFEDQARPRVGDWVVAVGNPFGLGGTATAGIVSALDRRNVGQSSYVDYMQIDAPINRGNSGGPTFDVGGHVVGVNTAIFSPSGGSVGIGFDIPADVAASVSRQLIAGGKVVRGYIGATIQNVTPDIAESLGLAAHKGALVADVTPGGPSAAAGLRSGDLIVAIDGHPVDSSYDLTRQVALTHAGETLHLQIRRDGQMRDIELRSGVRPSETALAENDRQPGAGAAQPSDSARVLGMRLSPDAHGGGVTIAGVGGDSEAGEKGLRPGDVILRAGDHATVTPADVSAAVAQARRDGRKDILLLVAHDGRRLFIPLKVTSEDG
jgi:serine protease Do